MKKRILSALLAGMMLVGALAGCGGDQNAANDDGNTTGGSSTVVIGLSSDLKTLDISNMYEVFGNLYAYATYDMPFRFDGSNTSEPQPSLVTADWTLDESKTVYTFPLRQDVTFSSGNALTSADFLFTVNRAINLKSNTYPYVENIASIEAPDDFTVVITLKEPDASFLAKLASNTFCILDSAVVKANGGTDAEDAATADTAQKFLDANSAGSGAYILESWTPSVELVLKKNENYWGNTGNVERYIIKEIPDANTQMQMLERGEIDIAYTLSADNMAQLEGKAGITTITGQTSMLTFLVMNADPAIGGPVADPKVQQAIRYAINYDDLLELCGEGASLPLNIVPQGMAGALTKPAGFRDLDAARALLAEAGYADGFDVTLTVGNYDTEGMQWTTIAQKLVSDLAEAGINVKIETAEIGVVIDQYRNGQTPLLLMHNSPDFLDLNNQLLFLPNEVIGKRANWDAAGREDMLALASQIRVTSDMTERAKYSEELQLLVAEDSPYAMLLQHPKSFAIADTLSNVNYNDMCKIQLNDIVVGA